MGPAGFLCLRHSIEHGRRAGLLTGLGATLGDLVYALLTYLSAGLVIEYVEGHDWMFRIIASVIFFLFAIYLYVKPPRLRNADALAMSESSRSLTKLGGGFAFTIANPLIVLVFTLLYSQLNFVYPLGEPPGMLWVGLFSIALGAFLWWLFITYIATKLRILISNRNLRIFNHLLAIVFALIALFSLVHTLSELSGHSLPLPSHGIPILKALL